MLQEGKRERREENDGSTCPGCWSKSVGRFRTGNGPGFTVDGQIVSMKIAMASPRRNVPISRENNDTLHTQRHCDLTPSRANRNTFDRPVVDRTPGFRIWRLILVMHMERI